MFLILGTRIFLINFISPSTILYIFNSVIATTSNSPNRLSTDFYHYCKLVAVTFLQCKIAIRDRSGKKKLKSQLS